MNKNPSSAVKKKILVVFGTRPEAIKMAPVVKRLREQGALFDLKVCVTAQHRELLDQVLHIFKIIPDYDLNVMKQDQDLYSLTGVVLLKMKEVLEDYAPDLVLVHGDTTTSFCAALASYYKQIAVGHVEAGLRTGNIYSPWPEEMNRKLTGAIARYHFAPTDKAKANLEREGVTSPIFITGNTVIDALFMALDLIRSDKKLENDVVRGISNYGYTLNDNKKFVLITGHRRENFGEGFIHICNAIRLLAEKYPELDFVYPVHFNPHVRKPVFEMLGGIRNIFLIEPMDYLPFIYMMEKSYLVLTDSGGIQEEAPGLGKPVIVMRDTSERPEAIDAGTVILVGTIQEKIVVEVSRLIEDQVHYHTMSKAHNPYGDGHAAEKIVQFLIRIWE